MNELPPKPDYPLEYFINLGLTPEEAHVVAVQWNRTQPQTLEEVRQGIEWERSGRDTLTEQRLAREKLQKTSNHPPVDSNDTSS